jgi:hypothetical protein
MVVIEGLTVEQPTSIVHRDTEEAFAVGRHAGGHDVTRCGAQAFPVSLTAPTGFPCPVGERGV